MGRRPIELTDIQRQEVEILAALLNQEQIADYLGIARNAFRAICERDPEIAARYKKGKAKAIAHVANGLLQKARSGDTVSSIFYLKTQAGWRETDRLEHSGPDGGPIEVRGARERLRLLVDGIAERTSEATRTALRPSGGLDGADSRSERPSRGTPTDTPRTCGKSSMTCGRAAPTACGPSQPS